MKITKPSFTSDEPVPKAFHMIYYPK